MQACAHLATWTWRCRSPMLQPPSPPRSEAREACQPHVAKTTPTGRCVGNCATKALTTIGHPASRLELTGTLQPNFAARPLQGSCSDFCGLAGLRACLYVHLGCAHLIRRERGDVRLCGAVNLACACPLPHMHRFCLPVAAHALCTMGPRPHSMCILRPHRTLVDTPLAPQST